MSLSHRTALLQGVAALAIHSAYTPKPSVALSFEGPGRTKQSFKDETDVNKIVSNFQRTGLLPQSNDPGRAGYFDCVPVQALGYQGALELVARAQDQFMELPAKIRARFGNDPAQLLGFLSDKANRPEAEALGLVPRETPPPPPPLLPTPPGHPEPTPPIPKAV